MDISLLGAPFPYFENNEKEHLKFLNERATYWKIPKLRLTRYISKPHVKAIFCLKQ